MRRPGAVLVDHDPGHPVGPPGRDGQAVRPPFEPPVGHFDSLDVGPQQFATRSVAGEVRADEVADGAVLAVAGDEVSTSHQDRTVVAGRLGLDVLSRVGDRPYLVATPDLGAQPGRPPPQQPFGVGLRHLPLAREAAGQCQVERNSGEVSTRVVRRDGSPVQQPPAVEDFHGAGVQGRRTRLGGGRRTPFQYDDMRAAEAQFPGEQQPDRSRAHDDDLGVQAVARHVSPALRRGPRRTPWRGRGWPRCWWTGRCARTSGRRPRWPRARGRRRCCRCRG